MTVGTAMAKELEAVSSALKETVKELEEKLSPAERKEFAREKSSVREILERKKRIVDALDDHLVPASVEVTRDLLCTRIDALALPLLDQGRLNEPEKERLRDLRNRSERLDRKLELLHPASERYFIDDLLWTSQRGSDKVLDLVIKIKATPRFRSPASILALRVAQRVIVEREYDELCRFFDLSSDQFVQVIEATIARCRAVTSPNLRKAFNAERPTQVTKGLKEIKAILEDLFEPPRIKEWLNMPLQPFDGRTPRQALLEGKTFPVLHLLRSFDEGPHY